MSRKMVLEFSIDRNGSVVVRSRVPFVKVAGRKFSNRKYSLPNEESPFLNKVLPCDYVQLTTSGTGQTAMVAQAEWLVQSIRFNRRLPNDPTVWKFLMGIMEDDGGDMIMVPANYDMTLKDLGIFVHDQAKFQKYIKRVKAYHKAVGFGEVLDFENLPDGSLVRFKMENGYVGTCRNVDINTLDPQRLAIADGQLRVKTNFLKELGHDMRVRNWGTYSCKFTGFTPQGVLKGYAHSQPDLEYDVVMYGAKEAVTYENIFFGILGDLSPGRTCRMDIQSIINFRLEPFIGDAFGQLVEEMEDRVADPERVDEDLLRVWAHRQQEMMSESERSWYVVDALTRGISEFAEPGLYRKLTQQGLRDVEKVEQGRIAMDYAAMRTDIVPDPHMFDSKGDIHPDRTVIPAGHMVCMDVPQGRTAEYRQPNGHPMEHSRSINIHDSRFKAFTGLQRSFYGSDIGDKNLVKNGADNDDSQTVVFDQNMVNHFYNLDFRVGRKITANSGIRQIVKELATVDRVKEITYRESSYGPNDFIRSMNKALQVQLRIGQIVNALMLDALLSGKNKEAMLDSLLLQLDLETDPGRAASIKANYNWLVRRPQFILYNVATNLEAMIDWCTQGKGDPIVLGPMEKLIELVMRGDKTRQDPDFHTGPRVFPRFWAGRISRLRVQWVDYVLADSLIDQQFDVIVQHRESYKEILRNREWEFMSYVPAELEMAYPHDVQIVTSFVDPLRAWWNQERVAISSIIDADAGRAAHREVLHGRMHVCYSGKCPANCPNIGQLEKVGLVQKLQEIPEDLVPFVVLELKRYFHRPDSPARINAETGQTQHVGDALFFNDVVFPLYMELLDKHELSGQYVRVELEGDSRKLGDETLWVTVENGIVYDMTRKPEDRIVGGLGDWQPVPNGEYRMAYGYLEVRKADPSISGIKADYGSDVLNLDVHQERDVEDIQNPGGEEL